MSTIHNVLHPGARPIAVSEFIDAVRATCKPRFPQARGIRRRPVAIAVSGGVDSMALAFLCFQSRKSNPDIMIADNPVSGFRGFIIDHGLRAASAGEANATCAAVKKIGFPAEVHRLRWTSILGSYGHPSELPNFETVARTLRYRKLGAMCAIRRAGSLLLAHHEDDQYETVLMRLLQGHGSRGLQGMKEACNIPECQGLFGAHGSGFVDDQRLSEPFYNMKPTRSERNRIRSQLRSHFDGPPDHAETQEASVAGISEFDAETFYLPKIQKPIVDIGFRTKQDKGVELPQNVEVEDGGIMIYRPLLEFSKDRLIATCLENNIPWFDDATNRDPTLTMRNAIRHMYKGYTLPEALQKPAILALAKRCRRRVQIQEAEAKRLLARVIVHDLIPHSGMVTVHFPQSAPRQAERDLRSPERRRARILKQREIAAIVMRKILELVTPESELTPLVNLENLVPRLFPSLALPEEATAIYHPPKAFNVCGVHLVPTQSGSGPPGWLLSRAPYQSTLPLPRVRTQYWAVKPADGVRGMTPHPLWQLWDNRFWIWIRHRLPYRVVVQPFLLEHAKPFRESLAPADRRRLAALLARCAPAKVRYTLPALYLEEPLDLGSPEFAPRPGYPCPEDPTRSLHPGVLDPARMQLIALPSLHLSVPHVDRWLTYEVRYRHPGRETLETAGTFRRGIGSGGGGGGRAVVGRRRGSPSRQRARRARLKRAMAAQEIESRQCNISQAEPPTLYGIGVS
ncbi:adenine nucleotide alpha hydrolases-like protein [Durotheca rogersii]|uniref:adenine nucleotide alpha hydrolases-like protein n=1 Tax=Durotheca rogersii TaxID=419775 RepID=UPI00221E8314|nr:adenine nucleotide alpha hydrolases-like protein [Durotheca rogersii]KAI5864154.1 adenine nucleotide alpha hydrolases-like protein [Durotheca rogersii]